MVSDTCHCVWFKNLNITWHPCELVTFIVVLQGALAADREPWPSGKIYSVQASIDSVYSVFSMFLKAL